MENHEGYANQAFRAETHEASPVAKKFDILKEKFNSLKLTEVIGDKDRAKIGEKSRDFFDTFSRGYRSVEHMEEIAGDVNKTETQKQAAMDDLDLLGKVVYESVREDEKFSRFIGEGSANKIDENLPEEFRGIGKVVLTNVFEEGPVLNALKELDENRAELSRMPEGATREKLTRGMVNKTIRKLVNMKDLTPGQKHDRQMSLGYLGAELEKFGEGKKNEEKSGGREKSDTLETGKIKNGNEEGDNEIVNELRKMRELDEEQIVQKRREEEQYVEAKKRSLEQARFETFQAMLLHKNPIQLDVFQQYAPEWMKEEKDKPLMQTLVALSNSCFYKWKYGDTNLDVMVDPRGEATFNAPNEMMQKMYEIPGVRQTMETIVNTFFEEGKEKGIDKNGEEKDVFVFRLKRNGKGKVEDVVKRIQNIGTEQDGFVKVLENEGLKKSDAMMAVSTAYNLLYVGHVFEDADKDRELSPCDAYVEQMRTFMFPAAKARSKYGLNKGVMPATEKRGEDQKISVGTEEGWGGQLGQWLTEVVIRAKHKINAGVSEKDPDIQFFRQYQKGEIHPFPERLFASFFTITDVAVEDENRKSDYRFESLAEALYKGDKVNFEVSGKGANPWGSYYDVSDSANKLYKIVKGDQKSYQLPLGDDRNFQAVASWVHEVSDARKKVRDQKILRPHVGNREFVKWIIAACVQGGIYPYSAELVLMTPDVEGDQDVSFDGLLKRRDLLEDDSDKKWLKKEFHAENFSSRLTRRRIIKRIGKRKNF